MNIAKAVAVAAVLVLSASVAYSDPTLTSYSTGDCQATNLTFATDGAVWFVCASATARGR